MLFIVRNQRTQNQGIRNVVDQTQVGQRLAGNLAKRFTGHQRLHAVAFSHFRRRTHHHTLEHHAHLAVVDFLENFAHHRFEVDRHKTHAMRTAEAVPQVVRNLTNADFMRRAAKVKEAVVYAAAATHQHIAGNAGVETTGDQRQHVFLGANRETANTFITPFYQQQTIVLDFEIDGHIRVGQLHARRFNMLVQTAAHITLNLNGGEFVLTATFNPHAEGFIFQRFAPQRQRLLENIVQGGERHVFHFEDMVNPRNARQRVANNQTLVLIFCANFDVIPVTNDGERFIVVFKNVTNVPG